METRDELMIKKNVRFCRLNARTMCQSYSWEISYFEALDILELKYSKNLWAIYT